MIYCCLIVQDRLETHGFEENSPSCEWFCPLSPQIPCVFDGARLTLPAPWRVLDGAGQAHGFVPAAPDANYLLRSDDGSTATLMLRALDKSSLLFNGFLAASSVTIGRSRANDLAYREGNISSAHGVLRAAADGSWTYTDASTNGSAVNGRLLRGASVVLRAGDHLIFPPALHVIFRDGILFLNQPAGLIQNRLASFAAAADSPDLPVRLQSLSTGFVSAALLPALPASMDQFWQWMTAFALQDHQCPERATLFGPNRLPVTSIQQLTQLLQAGQSSFFVD